MAAKRKTIKEEAILLIAEWDALLSFVNKNKLPHDLINRALDHRKRLMDIRDSHSLIDTHP